MADHSNINEPTYRAREDWAARVEVEKLKLALQWTEKERDHYRSNLEAIFNRIGRGDHVDLYFDDGTHVRLERPTPTTPPDGEGRHD